jgi:TRAP-type C4-dicarboxylate transport system substrate-binding protein
MALQQGTLQGAGIWMVTVLERKIYEVAPYFTYVPVAGMFTMPMMNKAFFEKLAPEMQKVIMDASKEMEEKSLDAAIRAQERVIEFSKSTGKIQIYYPNKEEMALWGEHKEAIWKEALKGDKELEGLVANIRSVISQK